MKDEQRQKSVQGDFYSHIFNTYVFIFFRFDTVDNIRAKFELRFWWDDI